MDKILGNGGTLVTEMNKITAEFATGNANTFAGKIAEAIKTPPNGAFTFKDEYNKFETAVNNSVVIIDEALEREGKTKQSYGQKISRRICTEKSQNAISKIHRELGNENRKEN